MLRDYGRVAFFCAPKKLNTVLSIITSSNMSTGYTSTVEIKINTAIKSITQEQNELNAVVEKASKRAAELGDALVKLAELNKNTKKVYELDTFDDNTKAIMLIGFEKQIDDLCNKISQINASKTDTLKQRTAADMSTGSPTFTKVASRGEIMSYLRVATASGQATSSERTTAIVPVSTSAKKPIVEEPTTEKPAQKSWYDDSDDEKSPQYKVSYDPIVSIPESNKSATLCNNEKVCKKCTRFTKTGICMRDCEKVATVARAHSNGKCATKKCSGMRHSTDNNFCYECQLSGIEQRSGNFAAGKGGCVGQKGKCDKKARKQSNYCGDCYENRVATIKHFYDVWFDEITHADNKSCRKCSSAN